MEDRESRAWSSTFAGLVDSAAAASRDRDDRWDLGSPAVVDLDMLGLEPLPADPLEPDPRDPLDHCDLPRPSDPALTCAMPAMFDATPCSVDN